MTTTKKQPIAFSGSGSAIDNYMSSAPVETVKVENWAGFTPTKPNPTKRKVLFSLMHQAQWTTQLPFKGEIPDLIRLSDFLQSEKSPVKKKLKDMSDAELEKLIAAFKGIVKSKFK